MIFDQHPSFSVKIKNVPTPSAPCELDVNKFIIQMTTLPSKLTVYTKNYYLTNQLRPISFTNQTSYISSNYDYIEDITFGTYTKNIPLRSSSSVEFSTNLYIYTLEQGFRFVPQTFTIMQGQAEALFRIGVPETMQDKQYAL